MTDSVDTSTASIARVYDAFLGGKDNFAVDREVHDAIVEIAPEGPALAQDGRRFLSRAVTHLAAEGGIDQFLDVGCGMPTRDNTHEAAQRVNPDAVVVYVDNDPAVAAYGRAFLTTGPNTHLVNQDLRAPDAVFSDPILTGALDFTRPIALMQCGTLHHLDDDDQPDEVMHAYIDVLPAGSFVVFSHFYLPDQSDPGYVLAREIERRFRASSMGTSRFRSTHEITALLAGLELLPSSSQTDAAPIVPVGQWWPSGPPLRPARPMDSLFVGGLGHKPASTSTN